MNRFHAFALCAWEICVIASLATLGMLTGNLSSNKETVAFFAVVAASGLLVVALTAFFARSVGTVGAAVTGLSCGLVPSVLLFLYAEIGRPGFEASAAVALMAIVLAIPSGVGGVLAGILCSWPNRIHENS